jgi:hypothetical protein
MTDEPKSWGQQTVGKKELIIWLLGFGVIVAFFGGFFSPPQRSSHSEVATAAVTVSCDEYNVCTPSNASEHVRACNQIMSNGRRFVEAKQYSMAVQAAALAGQMNCDFKPGQ